jgi:DNA polymerase-1
LKILVNYDKALEGYKPVLAALLRSKGLQALSTSNVLTITQLQEIATKHQCEGILLANEDTLKNCINSSKKVTLDKYRGSRLNFTIPAIVSAPIDHLRIVRHGKWLWEQDLNKFRDIKKKITQIDYKVCDTEEKLLEACAVLTSGLALSIDIETNLFNQITCIGFSTLTTQFGNKFTTVTYIIPLLGFNEEYWITDELYSLALECCRDICKSSIPKIMFNGGFDSFHLLRYNFDPVNFIIDVMGLAHSEYSETPKSLDFVASWRLYDYYYWKDEADEASKTKDLSRYWTYCARDAWNTLRIFLTYCKQENRQTWTIPNYQQKFKVTYPYLYSKFEGCLISQEALKDNRKKAVTVRDKAENDLRVMAADPEFNPASPKQVGEILFDILGAIPIKNKRTTGAQYLELIRTQHPILDTFVDALLDYREKAKAISTYFDFIQINGRMLYDLSQWSTDTSRSSCRQSSLRWWDIEENDVYNCGAQIQNIPSYAKNMIIADEGFVMGEADHNKAEARCVAYLSSCTAMIASLEDKSKDFYKVLATLFFGVKYEEVSKELRNDVVKRIVHGRNYLMGADTFITTATPKRLFIAMAMLGKSTSLKEFATWLLSLYNEPFPEVNEWYKEVKLEVLRTQKLKSVLGYTRYFFGDVLKDHKVYRNAVAHGPQNLNVMILDKSLWKVYQNLVLGKAPNTKMGEFRFKAQIHDSIFYQVIEDRKEFYNTLLLQLMSNPVEIKGKVMRIPIDISNGRTWAEVKGE